MLRGAFYRECYVVRFTGIGPCRLFGYLSIPHGDGPLPTLLNGPGYRSVVEPLPQGDANEKRGRFMFSRAPVADNVMQTNRTQRGIPD